MYTLKEKSETLAEKVTNALMPTLSIQEKSRLKGFLAADFLVQLKKFEEKDKMALLGETLMLTLEEKAKILFRATLQALDYYYRGNIQEIIKEKLPELRSVLLEEIKTMDKLPEGEPGIAY